MAQSRKKKKNLFVAYFTPFGLRQICDLLMLAGAITIFVGIFVSVYLSVNIVAAIGMGLYVIACGIAIFRTLRIILQKDINKRSPEYKNAVINLCIMIVILVAAVFGIIAAFIW